jgi:DNA replication protein DnaC
MSGARDLAYLCRELKAPSLLAGIERLATRAREEVWSHEDFLAACLEREVSSRQSHGGEARIASARFPARKSLEDFDFEHQRSVRKDVVAHLGALDFIEAKSNAVFLGPSGCGGHCAFLPSTLIIRSRSAQRPQRLLVFSA